MKKVMKFYYDTSTAPDEGGEDEGEDVIHIVNHGITTLSSLCGHCDRAWEQVQTDRKPTCYACLEVWNMIKKGKI